jgi:hypothetical protein
MAHYCQLADSWLTSKKFRVDKIVTLTELQSIKRS